MKSYPNYGTEGYRFKSCLVYSEKVNPVWIGLFCFLVAKCCSVWLYVDAYFCGQGCLESVLRFPDRVSQRQIPWGCSTDYSTDFGGSLVYSEADITSRCAAAINIFRFSKNTGPTPSSALPARRRCSSAASRRSRTPIPLPPRLSASASRLPESPPRCLAAGDASPGRE